MSKTLLFAALGNKKNKIKKKKDKAFAQIPQVLKKTTADDT